MTRDQAVDERAGQFIPEQGAVGIVMPALCNEGMRNTEKIWIGAGESLDQLGFEGRIFCGRESEMARIDTDENSIDASLCVSCAVDARRTDGQ